MILKMDQLSLLLMSDHDRLGCCLMLYFMPKKVQHTTFQRAPMPC